MIESSTLLRALSLPDDATNQDILDRIVDLREDAGEEVDTDLSERELIKRGEHDNVSITADGAVVSLYVPIKSGSEEITTLTMKRPTARDIRKLHEGSTEKDGTAKNNHIERSMRTAAGLTGRAFSDLENLDSADLNLLLLVFGFLQRPPRRTGSRS